MTVNNEKPVIKRAWWGDYWSLRAGDTGIFLDDIRFPLDTAS